MERTTGESDANANFKQDRNDAERKGTTTSAAADSTTITGLEKINNNNNLNNASKNYEESDSFVSSIKGDISAAFQLFNQVFFGNNLFNS